MENYKMWYATLSKEEQKKEDERRYNQGACESVNKEPRTDWAREYESIIKKM